MLRYIHAADLPAHPRLADTMFRDRAAQFAGRLGWEVRVNAAGHERDEYDDLAPLYLIWEGADGTHHGSMRFLPTTGPTMVNDHFGHLAGARIESPLIWECTRFCISPRAGGQAGARASAALVLGAGEIMARFHLRHFVGVFDPRMERIYNRFGLAPDVIGRKGDLGVGLWEMRQEAWAPVLARLGIDRAVSAQWWRASFGGAAEVPLRRSA